MTILKHCCFAITSSTRVASCMMKKLKQENFSQACVSWQWRQGPEDPLSQKSKHLVTQIPACRSLVCTQNYTHPSIDSPTLFAVFCSMYMQVAGDSEHFKHDFAQNTCSLRWAAPPDPDAGVWLILTWAHSKEKQSMERQYGWQSACASCSAVCGHQRF